MEQVTYTQPTRARGRFQHGSRFVLFAFLAIAGFYLLTEHTAHVFGILPYLLVLLCPLLHLLHGGHGGGHRGHGTQSRQNEGGPQ